MIEYRDQDEITLKEIILKIVALFKELKSRWKFIFLVSIIFGSIWAIKTLLQPAFYKEQLIFMMDESTGGNGGMFSELEMLGDLFGGKTKSDNLGKILQLFETKRIIHNTLFDTIEIGDKTDFLANAYLERVSIGDLTRNYKYFGTIGFKHTWVKQLFSEPYFRFTHSRLDSFTVKENQFLRLLYEYISGNPDIEQEALLESEMDKSTGIMTLNMKSQSEDLTLWTLTKVYNQVSDFFIEKAVEKQKKTFDIMKSKRDSVLTELKTAEYNLAKFRDSNRNQTSLNGHLNQVRLEREVSILNVMYAEVVRQLELTDFTLKNTTPVVQIIDTPRRPIVKSKSSWIKSLLLGGFIGAFLAGVWVLARVLIKDILEN